MKIEKIAGFKEDPITQEGWIPRPHELVRITHDDGLVEERWYTEDDYVAATGKPSGIVIIETNGAI